MAEPWDGPNNARLAGRMPSLFRFHVNTESGTTTANYLAVVGAETVWNPDRPVRQADVTDDPGSTILIVENLGAGVHWMEPRDLAFADLDFGFNTPGGIGSPYDNPAVVTADGAVHRLLPTLAPDVLRALLTARGGEPVGPGGGGGWEFLADGRDRPRRGP